MDDIDRLEIPCKFDLELKSDGATRRQIVKRLHEIIFRIETLHRGVTGSGLFLENWKCEAVEGESCQQAK